MFAMSRHTLICSSDVDDLDSMHAGYEEKMGYFMQHPEPLIHDKVVYRLSHRLLSTRVM